LPMQVSLHTMIFPQCTQGQFTVKSEIRFASEIIFDSEVCFASEIAFGSDGRIFSTCYNKIVLH